MLKKKKKKKRQEADNILKKLLHTDYADDKALLANTPAQDKSRQKA